MLQLNTETIDQEETLSKLLIEFESASITANNHRYFHVNTIRNLILHFHEIEIERDRTWIYENLMAYFHKCSELGPSIDRKESISLYKEYLDKITDYYNAHLGFTVLMNNRALYTSCLILLILLYFLFGALIMALVALICVIQFILSFRKYRMNKVYGLFW